MEKKKNKKFLASVWLSIAVVVTTVVLLDVVESAQQLKTVERRKRKDTIVEFDPYVSILDKHNRYRYNITDLIPMVRTIATEFNTVLIDLTQYIKVPNPDLAQSIFLCASAVAHYNNQYHPPLQKVEVWLVIFQNYMKKASPLINLVSSMADNANRIHNGTVTTIVFNNFIFEEQTSWEATFRKNYKLAMWIAFEFCETVLRAIEHARPNIILLGSEDWDWSPNYLERCNTSKLADPTEVAQLVFISDSYSSGKVNMTRLVRKWNAWRKLADEGVASVVISKAFDTPYNDKPFVSPLGHGFMRTTGWWRLRENTSYSGTGSYSFEAKNMIAEKSDRDMKSTNLTGITADGKTPSEYVGVILEVLGTDARKLDVHENLIINYTKTIVKLTETIYRKIALYLKEDYLEHANSLYFFSLSYNLSQTGNVFLLMPSVIKWNYNSQDTKIAKFANQTFIFHFDSDKLTGHQVVSRQILSVLLPKKKGYSFPIKYCTMFPLAENHRREILNVLNESDVAVFYFAEERDVVTQGARKMFEERVVQFEECRRFLVKATQHLNKTGHVELSFLMLHYAHPNYIYGNPPALFNFVRYWKMIAAWAEETRTTVIMNNADDGRREYNGKAQLELGWWRAVPRNNDGTIDYIDKEAELRNMLPQQEQQPDEEPPRNTKEIIISSSVTGGVMAAVFSLAIVMLRRHLKKQILSGKELRDFLLGTTRANDLSNEDPTTKIQCLPYEKFRYEIDSKSIQIDENKTLGSGEFGLVCAAKIEKSPGVFVNAAVKMVNTAKFRKTTLTGLLSEIKVLAYLGKHDNLIELIGASTAELKKGKVLVILELCPLGSLEKHLRALCPPPSDSFETENGFELTDMNNYANANAQFLNVLDPSLSADLYRWSKEICNGMSFLTSKHVVHADLATRNVLLGQEKTAKICDFGLSRRMYNYANYVKQHQEPLPWKWMPPESLRRMEFNEKSDVWAYGVTLWEMYSLGDTPYPGLSWTPTFFQMLERGFRMSRPKYSEKNIWSIIEKCWRTSPDGRPKFEELLLRFSDISVNVA